MSIFYEICFPGAISGQTEITCVTPTNPTLRRPPTGIDEANELVLLGVRAIRGIQKQSNKGVFLVRKKG